MNKKVCEKLRPNADRPEPMRAGGREENKAELKTIPAHCVTFEAALVGLNN